MTGMLAMWLATLIVVVAMDAAVSARLAAQAVRRYQRQAVGELQARSAVEYAVMLLHLDSDRSRDDLSDVWARAQLPDSGRYRGVWPQGARLTITDLHGLPAPVWPRSLRGSDQLPQGHWLNVLTAGRDAWEAVGLSAGGAACLVDRASLIREPGQVTSLPGLSGHDVRLLGDMLARGTLAVRSEFFLVRYCAPTSRPTLGSKLPREACRTFVLHREHLRGIVRVVAEGP